jgi:hypothetical protein
MRKFEVEVANDENWERIHRIIKVYACTVKGARKRAHKKIKRDESIYQICTRVKDCELWQPVWDFFNGNISRHFGLKL